MAPTWAVPDLLTLFIVNVTLFLIVYHCQHLVALNRIYYDSFEYSVLSLFSNIFFSVKVTVSTVVSAKEEAFDVMNIQLPAFFDLVVMCCVRIAQTNTVIVNTVASIQLRKCLLYNVNKRLLYNFKNDCGVFRTRVTYTLRIYFFMLEHTMLCFI